MDGPYTIHFNSYEEGGKVGKPETLEVDAIIGADGANSRVAKEIDAGEYDYAIAFQERIRIPEDKMDYYKDLAEMYVGDDVSPDFYGWVFPKYDHVAVGALPILQPLHSAYVTLFAPSFLWCAKGCLHICICMPSCSLYLAGAARILW